MTAPSNGCEGTMSDAQIKYMVDRFLGWRLPETFNPDAGISFKPYHGIPPTGTNLFDATQAEAMIRHLVEGMPVDSDAPSKESLERARRFRGLTNPDSWVTSEVQKEIDNLALEFDAIRRERNEAAERLAGCVSYYLGTAFGISERWEKYLRAAFDAYCESTRR